jgi:hypothetical protein
MVGLLYQSLRSVEQGHDPEQERNLCGLFKFKLDALIATFNLPHTDLCQAQGCYHNLLISLLSPRDIRSHKNSERQVDLVIGKSIPHIACVGSRYHGPPGTSKMNPAPTPVRVAETTHLLSLRSSVRRHHDLSN